MANLAKPGDPLVLGTGIVVMDDDNGKFDVVSTEEYNERRKIPAFKTFKASRILTLDTMPEADAQQQVVIAAIIGLVLTGLETDTIAEMMNVHVDEIKKIINLPSTQATFERVFRGLIATNAETVQGRIASHADNAVSVVLKMMNDDKTRDDVRLKAAQDVLDRSGTSADNFFVGGDRGSEQDDELRITIMDESGETEKIKVEIGKKKR